MGIMAYRVAALLVVFAVAMAGCISTSGGQANGAVKSPVSVKVPKNLFGCSSKYFKKADRGYEIDCDRQPQDHVCSYYEADRNGLQEVGRREFQSDCAACRFYGEGGRTSINGVAVVHLGFELSPCA
jgi:hypothetical protein